MRRLSTTGGPTALVLMISAAAVCGCAYLRVPKIDPTGERIFAEGPLVEEALVRNVPGPQQPWDRVGLVLCPRQTVAPVNSEVILLAGVRGPDQYLRTNERVEWMLAQNGVGQFVDVDKGAWTDPLVGDFTRARKIDNTFAVNSTSRRLLRLTRGTPGVEDDVYVLRGQAWVTLTSPVEGTSTVTAFAPNVHAWESRTQSAVIHWVDAQWSFPAPAINAAGSNHVFTTTVSRHTDQSPRTGWLVRYEIVSGPAAGFAPDGAQVAEVLTDESGRASVEIFQKQPAVGTNQIAIQVIRPAGLGTPDKPMVVGRGSTLKTWSSADLTIRQTGPVAAGLGATLSYRIEVSNSGDMPAEDVVVTQQEPDGMTYLDSSPPAERFAHTLQWRLGRLSAGESRTLEVDFRADLRGSVTVCAEATATGGLSAKSCASTAVEVPELDLQIYGPEQAAVGDEVTFEIVLTNRSQVPATELLIKDAFDPGFEHAEAGNRPIERELGDLGPQESKTIGIAFQVTGLGQLCHTVEVTSPGGATASARACLNAVLAPQPQPVPQPGPKVDTLPTTPATMSVSVTGPKVGTVGEMVQFTVDVANTGEQPLMGVNVVCELDASLEPKNVTGGYQRRTPDGAFMWTTETLPPGGTAWFELQCVCGVESARACARATVTTEQGARDEDEACLEIRPAAAPPSDGLTMTVDALRQPVAQGKELTYLIRVTNNGRVADGQVTVTATIPPELMPVALGTHGPTFPEIDGPTVRFQPVDTINSGETLEYRIRALAKQPGEVTLQAELRSRNLRLPMIVEEQTQIFEQR